jgi:hypothetical protein
VETEEAHLLIEEKVVITITEETIMDTTVPLLVEVEVVVWVLPGVSSDVVADLEVPAELVVHLEDPIKMKIRTMNTTKAMKMEQIDPVLAIVVVTTVPEHEAMALQELTAKVTTNPNKRILEVKRWNWMIVAVLKHQINCEQYIYHRILF